MFSCPEVTAALLIAICSSIRHIHRLYEKEGSDAVGEFAGVVRLRKALGIMQ